MIVIKRFGGALLSRLLCTISPCVDNSLQPILVLSRANSWRNANVFAIWRIWHLLLNLKYLIMSKRIHMFDFLSVYQVFNGLNSSSPTGVSRKIHGALEVKSWSSELRAKFSMSVQRAGLHSR